jgi:hypothetical protein
MVFEMDTATKSQLVIDLAKIFTIVLVYHLLWAFKYSEPMLTENFMYEVSFILVGVAFYHVVLSKHVKKYNQSQDNQDVV